MTATRVIDGRRRYPVVVRLDAPYRSTPEAVGQTLHSDTGRRDGHAVAGRTRSHGRGARGHRPRRRAAVRGRAEQRARPRPRRIRGRRSSALSGTGDAARGLLRDLRRAVREPGARDCAARRSSCRWCCCSSRRCCTRASATCATRCWSCSTCRSRSSAASRALWLRGLNLNLSASVGFIALFGVAVLNGVVLMAYINQLRVAGRALATQCGRAEVRLGPC